MCTAVKKNRVHKSSSKIKKKVKKAYPNLDEDDASDDEWYDVDDPNWLAAEDHIDYGIRANKKISVPLHIISPITQITWLWQCDNFRKNMDFHFQRPGNWNDNMPVYKFNHSFYMKFHNVLDWHDFIHFRNNVMIYPNVIVDPHVHHAPLTKYYYYVTEISYDIPDGMTTATKAQLVKMDKFDLLPKCVVTYQLLKQHLHFDEWILEEGYHQVQVDENTPWTLCDHKDFKNKIKIAINNNQFAPVSLQKPRLQHPAVAANKPFFFVILGCDKYHHTQFTGVNSIPTHGFYWWFANFNSQFQFNRICTMTTTQVASLLPLTTIMPIVYAHWQVLMEKGALLWTKEGLTKVYGMVSLDVGDMQDRDIKLRHRQSSARSRCDGACWMGYMQGCKYPPNCDNLLQLNVVIPGPYLLRLRQYLENRFVGDNRKKNINKIGKQISLTKHTSDVYNELPIASTLKSPSELNHMAMLGLLEVGFRIEWSLIHDTKGYDQLVTQSGMKAYLEKYWHGINGVTSKIVHSTGNWMKFNMINHSWQTFLEIMMSLPHVVNWVGNVNLLCNIIRMTGCLHSCVTENRRKQLQFTMKIILQQSLALLVFFCFCAELCTNSFIVFFFCFLVWCCTCS